MTQSYKVRLKLFLVKTKITINGKKLYKAYFWYTLIITLFLRQILFYLHHDIKTHSSRVNKELKKLGGWFTGNRLLLNIGKTKCIFS